MNKNKTAETILTQAYCEDMKRELAAFPSDEELRREFPITKEKRDEFIKRVYKKKKPIYITYLQRAAAFILVLSAVSFGVLIANPEIRADILEEGLKLFDEYFIFDIDISRSDDTVDFNNIRFDYIPINYNLEFEECTEGHYQSIYLNGNCYISIDIVNDENKEDVLISDSFTDFSAININGYNGYTSYVLNENIGLVVFGNTNYSIIIMGTISIEELMEIATNIKY